MNNYKDYIICRFVVNVDNDINLDSIDSINSIVESKKEELKTFYTDIILMYSMERPSKLNKKLEIGFMCKRKFSI